MDFSKLFEDYYENDKYQEIINIYEENKAQIIDDEDLMSCVIDSFLALRKYNDANILVDEKLSTLISIIGTREMTDDEKEDLDWFLDSKIEILYETKSYFKLLVLLKKYGNWIKDRELVEGMYKHVKKIIERYLLVLLFAVIILVEIGIYFAGTGSITPSLKPSFRFIRIVAIAAFFLVNLFLKFFHPLAKRSE